MATTRSARTLATAAATAAGTVLLPPRVAIVGAGPAGFYTAHRLLKAHATLEIDLYERLPAPFGLVRYGVAPDHPDVKNVIHKFQEVAASPRMAYMGNVAVGNLGHSGNNQNKIALSDLAARYSAVVVSTGATAADRSLGVPGEHELRGVYSARAFVGWYNGHPDFADLHPDLDSIDSTTAVVVGQGNVALDVARILLTPTTTLRGTDVAIHAVDALAQSRIRKVQIVGRRGPAQAAFTAKEMRELAALRTADPPVEAVVDAGLVAAARATWAAGLAKDRARSRLMGILETIAASGGASVGSGSRQWSLDFQLSPRAFLPSVSDPTRLGAVEWTENALSGPVTAQHPDSARATATAAIRTTNNVALAVTSIGYRAEPLDDLLPFDARSGTVPCDPVGRAVGVDRVYVAGWAKRGPTGVIASTMRDAYETADAVAADLAIPEQSTSVVVSRSSILRWLAQDRGIQVVDWRAWEAIAAYEKDKLGGAKVVRVPDMLRIAFPG
ncbi:hypothetical protein BC828DRAFT_406040 [Blastocladiella britannica]|nr:hypothetical protein BC828DRAFT_406040 [Blastocladiella britannica]